MKNRDKLLARKMRLNGATYSEISQKVSVSKSTISVWVRDITLSDEHIQRILRKKLEGRITGGEKRRQQRASRTEVIYNEAKESIKDLSQSDLFLAGVMLYWAEGAKQKAHSISQRVCFSSSDLQMIKIFLLWLDKICSVPLDKIQFELYIHERADIQRALKFWSQALKIEKSSIRLYLKKHLIKTSRKNISNLYHGQLRIVVKKSTDLNRKIEGWIRAITSYWGVV